MGLFVFPLCSLLLHEFWVGSKHGRIKWFMDCHGFLVLAKGKFCLWVFYCGCCDLEFCLVWVSLLKNHVSSEKVRDLGTGGSTKRRE